MPVHRVPGGYQWGSHGKIYTYKVGDEASREKAKAKAEAQGRAAHANGFSENMRRRKPM